MAGEEPQIVTMFSEDIKMTKKEARNSELPRAETNPNHMENGHKLKLEIAMGSKSRII